MKHYRLKIFSGPYANWYVGAGVKDGLVPNPGDPKPPPVNVPGSNYALWAQQSGATEFTDFAPAQEELKLLGYVTFSIELLSADEMPSSLTALKALVATLDQQIADKKTNDLLLGLAKNWLGDVERGVAPTSILDLVKQILEKVQKAVSEYGPKIRIIA